MFLRRNTTIAFAALSIAGALTLTGCASADPMSSSSGDEKAGSSDTIVIGSQDYYSNEIVAEIYAQALEDSGFTVDRQFRIGQREVYIPEIESGAIDLFPEYSGPLLQYWGGDTDARLTDDVYDALGKVTPDGLRLLDQSPATDQDSYAVTQEFADKWGVTKISDLTAVTDPLTLGANSEAESRPNGPQGLRDAYGVEVGFTPIEDGGGPLTVKALKDGAIQLAIIYTADPSLTQNKLVSLEDTKGLFLASHVVPVASKNIDDKAAQVVNEISAALTPEDLLALNARSISEELPAATIATDWLKEKKFI
jgi:osmoprotectant transport system substrate-binding protein